ncbi:MAG: hypothetical protein ACREBU_02765 [Nitrososphaera sp.]
MIAILIFANLSLAINRGFFYGDSLLNYRDLVWPTNVDRYILEAYAAFDLEAMRRILYFGPFLVLADLAGLSPLDSEKIFFWFSTFLAGISACYVVFRFMSSRLPPNLSANQNIMFTVAAAAGFFYVVNPFYMQKAVLMTYGFAFSYAMIPLVFYFFDKALISKNLKDVFLASICFALAVAGTMQFLVLLPVLLLVPWFIFTLVSLKVHKLSVRHTFTAFLSVAAMFTIISSYWIFPVVTATFASGAPQPSYVLTDLMLESFSFNTSFLNAFRLTGVWWPYIPPSPIVDQVTWISLSITVPILVICSVLCTRARKLQFLAVCFLLIGAIIMIFFKGAHEPWGEYYILLYSIPIFGWMFRVPDTNGIFLPFVFMMTMAFGMYGLLNWRRTRVGSFLRILPILILIPSTSIISWQLLSGNYGGIYRDENPYVDSATMNNQVSAENRLFIASRSFIIVGGSDLAASLHSIAPFTSDDQILFADKDIGTFASINGGAATTLTTGDKTDIMMHYISKEMILLEPFQNTFKHSAKGSAWSRASTSEPLHGPFKPYLKQFSLLNHDFDYGKGLVFGWKPGSMTIPFKVDSGSDYVVFARYLENPRGGAIEIRTLDTILQIYTRGDTTKFKWVNIGQIHFPEGVQNLELTNLDGFNAVNLVALVPKEKLPELSMQTSNYLQNGKVAILLDAQLDFTDHGTRVGTEQLFATGSSEGETFRGSIYPPEGSSRFSLDLYSEPAGSQPSSYRISEFSLKENTTLFSANFERTDDLALFKFDDRFVRLSYDQLDNISGSASLHADVPNSNYPRWIIIKIDPIPVEEDSELVYTLKSIESNMNELHGKIVYYDVDGRELSVDFVDIKETVLQHVKTPKGTDHVSIQYWFKSNAASESDFSLDDISLDRVSPMAEINGKTLLLSGAAPNKADPRVVLENDANLVVNNEYSPESTGTLKSQTFPLNPGAEYTYSITLDRVDSPHVTGAIEYYSVGTSNAIIDLNSTQYNVLRFDRRSEISANVSLLQGGNYTLAVRALKCPSCPDLTVSIAGHSETFSLMNDTENFEWVYLDASLPTGESVIRIIGDSPTAIDSVVLYSEGQDRNSVGGFIYGRVDSASIVGVDHKSPTELEVRVSAQKPFILTQWKEYNGLWTASVSDESYSPVRLEPNVNGFFIPQTGDMLTINIEYPLQRWFIYGLWTTLVALIVPITYLTARKFTNGQKQIGENRQFLAPTDVEVDKNVAPDTDRSEYEYGLEFFGAGIRRLIFVVIPFGVVAGLLAFAGYFLIAGNVLMANHVGDAGYVVLVISCIANVISFFKDRESDDQSDGATQI